MDEMEKQFTVTLKGNGIDVENSLDKKTALRVLSIIWGGETDTIQDVVTDAEVAAEGGSGKNHRVSMGEYLDEANASTNKERIVAIGMYVSEYKNSDTFGKEDVVAGFRSAREPLPRNIHRDISSAAEARWIEETEETGVYYVTNTGAKAVKAKFEDLDGKPKPAKKRSTSSRRNGTAKATTTTVDESINSKGSSEKKKPKSGGGELRKTVESWISEGFFNEPRTIGDLQTRFHERAVIVPQTSLSPLLVRVVRDGLLERKKQEIRGRQMWTYKAP
ncbi:hypothetical protein [Roseovarius indicus]|uniref:hypothetical protein n=1 Tax=Roseovarius indicus TaxID=540747 RepID=UPI0032ED767E